MHIKVGVFDKSSIGRIVRNPMILKILDIHR